MDDTETDQAIVAGASMAGLLAARVLADRFKRVIVIDRDVLPSTGEHRRACRTAGMCTHCTRVASRSWRSCSRACVPR
jgi:flavin-dependent dehydrogenase